MGNLPVLCQPNYWVNIFNYHQQNISGFNRIKFLQHLEGNTVVEFLPYNGLWQAQRSYNLDNVRTLRVGVHPVSVDPRGV